jgi:hypothetical protein
MCSSYTPKNNVSNVFSCSNIVASFGLANIHVYVHEAFGGAETMQTTIRNLVAESNTDEELVLIEHRGVNDTNSNRRKREHAFALLCTFVRGRRCCCGPLSVLATGIW